MTGLSIDADVTAEDGPADSLVRYPANGGAFVDLVGESLRECGVSGGGVLCCLHEY